MIFMLGGVLGTGFSVALGFFPFSVRVSAAAEQLSEPDRAWPVATGGLIHANPSDPVHWGRAS